LEGVRPGHAIVAFDEVAWSEDLRNATTSGRNAARRVRRKLESRRQPVAELLACDDEGRDGFDSTISPSGYVTRRAAASARASTKRRLHA
jgi:hypothetical protein